MARYTDSVCRLCRREGLKLFLKGERCYTDKCAIERRNYPPGDHGQGRPKFSEYAVQLREKQKVKRMYGLLERQFRRYFRWPSAPAASPARPCCCCSSSVSTTWCTAWGSRPRGPRRGSWCAHGHFLVNGQQGRTFLRTCAPRRRRERARAQPHRDPHPGSPRAGGAPRGARLARSQREAFSARVKALPTRADLTMPINEKLVVELYSK